MPPFRHSRWVRAGLSRFVGSRDLTLAEMDGSRWRAFSQFVRQTCRRQRRIGELLLHEPLARKAVICLFWYLIEALARGQASPDPLLASASFAVLELLDTIVPRSLRDETLVGLGSVLPRILYWMAHWCFPRDEDALGTDFRAGMTDVVSMTLLGGLAPGQLRPSSLWDVTAAEMLDRFTQQIAAEGDQAISADQAELESTDASCQLSAPRSCDGWGWAQLPRHLRARAWGSERSRRYPLPLFAAAVAEVRQLQQRRPLEARRLLPPRDQVVTLRVAAAAARAFAVPGRVDRHRDRERFRQARSERFARTRRSLLELGARLAGSTREGDSEVVIDAPSSGAQGLADTLSPRGHAGLNVLRVAIPVLDRRDPVTLTHSGMLNSVLASLRVDHAVEEEDDDDVEEHKASEPPSRPFRPTRIPRLIRSRLPPLALPIASSDTSANPPPTPVGSTFLTVSSSLGLEDAVVEQTSLAFSTASSAFAADSSSLEGPSLAAALTSGVLTRSQRSVQPLPRLRLKRQFTNPGLLSSGVRASLTDLTLADVMLQEQLRIAAARQRRRHEKHHETVLATRDEFQVGLADQIAELDDEEGAADSDDDTRPAPPSTALPTRGLVATDSTTSGDQHLRAVEASLDWDESSRFIERSARAECERATARHLALLRRDARRILRERRLVTEFVEEREAERRNRELEAADRVRAMRRDRARQLF